MALPDRCSLYNILGRLCHRQRANIQLASGVDGQMSVLAATGNQVIPYLRQLGFFEVGDLAGLIQHYIEES